jgi:hypothetical protein
MTISVQCVGIFFGATLPLDGPQPVLGVLEAVRNAAGSGQLPNVAAFNFETTQAPNQSLVSVAATYSGPVQGRGVGGSYPAGEYSLTESLNARPAYAVWQYYLLDAEGKPVSRGVKFLDDPAAIVPADGTVIWRLVSILAGPNPRSALVASRQAF